MYNYSLKLFTSRKYHIRWYMTPKYLIPTVTYNRLLEFMSDTIDIISSVFICRKLYVTHRLCKISGKVSFFYKTTIIDFNALFPDKKKLINGPKRKIKSKHMKNVRAQK